MAAGMQKKCQALAFYRWRRSTLQLEKAEKIAHLKKSAFGAVLRNHCFRYVRQKWIGFSRWKEQAIRSKNALRWSKVALYGNDQFSVLYCIVLYCIVLYCIVLQ